MELWKGRQKEKKTNNRKTRRTLKKKGFGGRIEKASKIAGRWPFWHFPQKKENKQTTKAKNPTPPPKKNKKGRVQNTVYMSWNITHYFGKNSVCSSCALFFLQRLCFAENTIQIVFSAEHSFYLITDTVKQQIITVLIPKQLKTEKVTVIFRQLIPNNSRTVTVILHHSTNCPIGVWDHNSQIPRFAVMSMQHLSHIPLLGVFLT